MAAVYRFEQALQDPEIPLWHPSPVQKCKLNIRRLQ